MATVKGQQKITPFLWFNENAEEAVTFYTSVFRNSKKGKVARCGKGTPMPEGTVLTVQFQLEGQKFIALNGGPKKVKFTEAVSFVVNCKTQKEIDYYWENLSKGGKKVECGWLKDKFGVSWQVVPEMIGEWLTDKSAERSGRVMKAVMEMKKLDLNILKKAYEGN